MFPVIWDPDVDSFKVLSSSLEGSAEPVGSLSQLMHTINKKEIIMLYDNFNLS